MTLFWKALLGALVVVILGLSLRKEESIFVMLMRIAACCMIAAIMASFMEPVISLLRELEKLAQLQSDFLKLLLKAAGIALVCEFTIPICQDSGNASVGKMIQLLGTAVILYISLPLIRTLVTSIQEILGG